ncbi:CPBP family intramembrane metalloprotease [Enterococcus sp. 669A]|uniref:CPBP family intramembrane metalloprotease n=1 Tax=Candidatus Enterococcus moelleringii TaxID=2815325 RepID=A0ABS3LBY8_9ENTE|nr:type II CAAX endopeptidase family protein [Enterococcus sp. 669A]MBO1307148.1 CPBP family intramembrane metalloprotease [Enterococcus sp. 669A]
MEEKKQLNLFIRIVLWIVLMILATMPMTVVMLAGTEHAVVGGIVLLVLLAFFVFIAKKSEILTTNEHSFLGQTKKLGPSIGWAVGGGVFLRVFVMLLALFANLQATENDQALQTLSTQASPVLMFFAMVVMAPVLEELVFRGFFFKFFFRKYPILAFVFSSVLFTVVHVPTDFISFFTYASLALTMAFVYYKTRRIEMSMLTHALNNFLPALVMVFFM